MNVKRRATAARPRFLILLPILIAGCQDIQHQNTADWVSQDVRVSSSPLHDRFMKGTYYEPVRDFFDSRAAFSPHFSPGFAFLRWAQALLSDGKWFVSNKRIRQEGLDDDRV